jgi:hypothetical protein
MRWISIFLLVAIACFAAVAATASAQQNLKQDPLGMGSWERIVSTEHTAEYLAKTGGVVEPDITGYPYWNAAGNWSFELLDSNKMRPLGDIDLRLFQAGNLLFGKGLLSEGLRLQPVTADGYLTEGNSIVLNVVSLEDAFLYRLVIDSHNPNSISGSMYIFTPAGGEPIKGSLGGGKNEPRTFSPLEAQIPS